MFNLKYSYLILFITFLAACTSQPAYREAKNGGFGYSDSKLTDTQYRVNFKGRGSDKTKAMDYAMLRAAELSIENGMSWFKVEERETTIDKETVQPSVVLYDRYDRFTNCGLISCRTTYYPSSALSTGVFVGGSERSEIEVTLNIRMGNDNKPESAFNAKKVIENLKPEKS